MLENNNNASLETIQYEREQYQILKTIVDTAYDELLIVDSNGYITMITEAYKNFLHIEDGDLIGKHVTEVIENTRLHIVAKSGIAEIAQLQKINDSYTIASRIPIVKDGKVVSVVGKIVFRNIGELDELYSKVGKIEQQLENYKDELTRLNQAKYTFNNIIGKNPQLKKVVLSHIVWI